MKYSFLYRPLVVYLVCVLILKSVLCYAMVLCCFSVNELLCGLKLELFVKFRLVLLQQAKVSTNNI